MSIFSATLFVCPKFGLKRYFSAFLVVILVLMIKQKYLCNFFLSAFTTDTKRNPDSPAENQPEQQG